MKRFVIKLLVFCTAPLAVLMPLWTNVDEGLRKSRYFYYAEWNDLFDGNVNADLIILGTSRAWVQFSPRILDSVLGIETYNMGMDGAPFDVQYERLKLYLRHNKKPKYIIQEVGFNTTFAVSLGLPLYQQFLPYLHDSAVWRMVKKAYPAMGVANRYFPGYKYNNQIPLIKEGIWSYLGKSRPPLKYKGYQGQTRVWDSSFSMMVKKNPNGLKCSTDTNAVNLFKHYLTYCNANNIKVIMVYAPFYYEMNRYINNHEDIIRLINDLSQTYGAPLLDYTNCSIDSNKSYFYNSQHLNKEGSEVFSNMLAEDLKKLLQ